MIRCTVCNRDADDLLIGVTFDELEIEQIRKLNPYWVTHDGICRECVANIRVQLDPHPMLDSELRIEEIIAHVQTYAKMNGTQDIGRLASDLLKFVVASKLRKSYEHQMLEMHFPYDVPPMTPAQRARAMAGSADEFVVWALDLMDDARR